MEDLEMINKMMQADSIGFANWLLDYYIIDNCYYVDYSYNRYTTEELYKLYLESL